MNIERYELCRKCKHMALSHTSGLGTSWEDPYWELEQLQFRCAVIWSPPKHKYIPQCKCKGFMPKDNLKYLESRYDKKNK